MLRRLIGEDIQLVVELHPEGDTIQADEGQLQQVIMSLAVNSRDAMPRGGRLTLKTSRLDVTSDNPNGMNAGSYVLLAISDTGCGMTDEVRSHVFEPFFTTKPTGQGTGLGLATVYGIVKQSGGHIWFDSSQSAGTTFFIAFPAVPGNPPTNANEISGKANETGSCILLVEDQREVRTFARIALERAGYRVIEAGHGGEALDVVTNPAGQIDLVISDVVMPDIGGYRLAERVVQVRPGLPFLFVTGYPDIPEERPDGRPIRLLQKPFTGQELIARVQELLPPRRD